MKRTLLFVFFLLGLAQAPLLAQVPIGASTGSSRLSGNVIHATTKQPVEFANVALLEAASSKLISAGACDDKGQFTLGNIGPGTYKLSVSFVGFQTKVVENVTVPAGGGVVSLGGIFLSPTTQQLSEVKVTGERELVENKVDRLVYNADKDISNAGGTATDVLQKVPMLSVDFNGNVQLRGSSSIRVLVNGKPSTLLATNLAEALRQIPADQIKSVEVITSPSAKYDAEGSAGVINIILKKNNLEGLNGSVNGSASTRGGGLNSTVNSRRGSVGLSVSAGTNWFYNVARSDTRRTDFLADNAQGLLRQQGDFTNLGGGAFVQLGLDYDLTPKDVFNVSARGNVFGYTNERGQFTSYITPQLADIYSRDITTKEGDKNMDLNAGYTKTLPGRSGHELSVLALYSVNKGNVDYNLDQQRAERRNDYRETSFNDSRNREATLQTDYVLPMDSTRTVELGGKIILRTVSSDYLIEADSLDGRGLVAVPERSNEFRYDQDVYAGYASYGFAMGRKLTAKLGARMEYTRINGDFITNNLRLQTDYSNFIPSALLAYDLGENQKLKFSYTRRLLRPSIYYLNPYINTSDRRNISAGNPTLDPELTDAYEIGYNTFINKSAITLTGYWRQTNNAIESLARLVPGSQLLPTDDTTRVLFTTYQNLARNATYGVSAFGSTKLTPKWNLSSNIDVYYMRLTSPALNLSNGGAMYNINFNSGWQFEKGWSLQMTGLFRSRRVELQGRAAGYRTYNIAVRKELFDKKGSLTVGVNNLFNRQLVFRNDFATDRFEFASDSYFYNRTVRVAFNYRFGKLENRPARPKKSISNDDQKAGG